MNEIGKLLIISGFALILFGIFFIFLPKINFKILPGDIFIKNENFIFYFPLMSGIIISIILSIIINIIIKILNK